MKTLKLSARSLLYLILASSFLWGCRKDQLKDDLATAEQLSASVDGKVSALPDPCIQRCLVAGQHTNVGTVDVALDNGDLLITYTISTPGIYLLETHTDIFSSLTQFKDEKKLSNGGAIPGKFAFKQTFSTKNEVTQYTVRIPKAYLDKYSVKGCLSIASHAALSNGETAWAGICADTPKGASLENARQFPGKNWSVYFDFCLDECATGVDFTYAWEDLQNEGNDADYNDLIVQADATKVGNTLKMNFIFPARGAAFDHEFKIRIAKQGITNIMGAAGYISDGSDYIITVVSSTKSVLPAYNEIPIVNTFPYTDCVPAGNKEVSLQLDNSFVFNTTKPFEPFITVYPSGTAGVGSNYNLSIFELSGQDTWTKDGKVYPNGILIPTDWHWPWEMQPITGPYPDFPNANWAANMVNTSLLWDRTKCD